MSSPSNPSFAAQINEVFDVDGMDCSEEVAAIERALKPVPGVLGVRAEIVSSKVTISHDGRPSHDDLAAAIRTAGVTVRSENNQGDDGRNWLRVVLVTTSGLTTGLGLLLQWFGWKDSWEPNVAFFVAILAGGALVLPKALRSLRTLTLDINVLMVVAVIGAVAIGEVAEGAVNPDVPSLTEH